MGSETNKYGLSRDIPSDIKRQIRQRCGFGCVVCGCGIYEYHHFNPEFREARIHEPDGIMLLCGTCHGKQYKGLFSRETIDAAAKDPRCRRIGYSSEVFDIGSDQPVISLGNVSCFAVPCLLRICGEELFSVLEPESENAPFRINAKMANSKGQMVFEISENEWRVRSDSWDAEQIGNRIIIRNAIGDIALRLRSEPPNRLVIEQLHMQWKDAKIDVVEGENAVARFASGAVFQTQRGSIVAAKIAFDIDERGVRVGVGGGSSVLSGTTLMGGGRPRSALN
jgi:hypothetical protein